MTITINILEIYIQNASLERYYVMVNIQMYITFFAYFLNFINDIYLLFKQRM